MFWVCLAACHAATFEEVAAQASAARDANDVPKAIELYGQAVALNPRWQEGWWFLGTFQYGSGRYDAARDAYLRVVELNPQMAPGWGLLGLSEFQTRDYGRSLEHVEKSLAMGAGQEPQIGEVLRYHEAVLLAKVGNFETSIDRFAPFVRAPAPAAEVVRAFGAAVLRLTLVGDEIKPDQRDLVDSAGKAAAMAMRGEAAAEAAFADLLTRFPKSRNVHYVYGSHLLAIDQRRARQEFERELAVSPGNPAAEAMLALVNNDPATVLRYAEKAVKDDPESSLARYVLGRVLVERGQAQAGIIQLEAAVKLDPANLENHVELATAYPMAAQFEQAKRERFRTLELVKERDARR